jgi:pilus assembly protein CpaE
MFSSPINLFMPDTSNSALLQTLSVALIVPDAGRRRSLTTALAESQVGIACQFDAYPSRADLPEIGRLACDIVIVDVDCDIGQAIRVIEDVCGRHPATTVMAYSSANDSTLMRRSMQAGAREFLIEPLLAGTVPEAFARTSSRLPGRGTSHGKLLVFIPSRAGVGVTTIATNFALALTKESGAKVVVVDMDFQLGEIALGLGLTAAFSVVDALVNVARLDKDFLATLLLRHDSGLAILSSPEKYDFFPSAIDEGADRLFRILREEFDYVVVDTGSCHGTLQEKLFLEADKLYLIAEITLPSLRNAHRLISFLTARDGSRALELVLNRFNSRHGEIDEKSATKALGRPVNWRVPNAWAAARAAQDTGIPLAMTDSPVARSVVQMARAACGKAPIVEKKAGGGFSFFGSKAVGTPAET